MRDYIGKSIIVAVLLLAATAAMGMDRTTMLTMFWGGSSAPAGTVWVDANNWNDAEDWSE